MVPKVRYFQRGNVVLWVDVNEKTAEKQVKLLLADDYVEVNVRPKRSPFVELVGAVIAGLVVSIVVGGLAWAAVSAWTAVFS